MTAPESCPICGAARLRRSFEVTGLLVARCGACGHGVARHRQEGRADDDYHEQYEQGAFLDALRATRRRQAALLVEAIRRHVPRASHLLDYGAGRGWFLSECRGQGISPLAGVDTSEISVSTLRAAGLEAHLIPPEGTALDLAGLRPSFPPRILTLLDVVEHLDPPAIVPRLSALFAASGDKLELVVIKVPIPGLLHGIARLLAALSVQGPLRQLYQAGTFPPHLSYFSPRSLETLLGRLGLVVVEKISDLDFEPARLADRTGMRGALARPIADLAGVGLGLAIRILRSFDTAIVLARPGGSPPYDRATR
jgi:hypothetical protein